MTLPEDPVLPPDETADPTTSSPTTEDETMSIPAQGEAEAEVEAEEGLVEAPVVLARSSTESVAAPVARAAARPDLAAARDPVYRECRGFKLRLDPPDLARLRELAGSRGKTDEELGEAFFDGQAERLAESVFGDVEAPAELRVVVDPYSRQAFLALENRIRGILSF